MYLYKWNTLNSIIYMFQYNNLVLCMKLSKIICPEFWYFWLFSLLFFLNKTLSLIIFQWTSITLVYWKILVSIKNPINYGNLIRPLFINKENEVTPQSQSPTYPKPLIPRWSITNIYVVAMRRNVEDRMITL